MGSTVQSRFSRRTGAPHSSAARVLIEFLSSPATLARLVSLGALEHVEARPSEGKLFEVDWSEALQHAEEVREYLQLTFIRS